MTLSPLYGKSSCKVYDHFLSSPSLPPPPLSQLIIAFSKIGFGCYEQTILSRQLIGGPFACETVLKKNKLYISTKKEETEELRRNFRFYL